MNIKAIIVSLSLIFCVTAHAAEWMILGVAVETYDHQAALLNKSCVDKACQAWRALKTPRPVALVGKGGRNPGSAVCSEQLKGKIVMGSRGHTTQAFCQFDDGSLLSLGALQ